MSKIKNFFRSLSMHWYVKYIVVCVLGVLVVGFLDENSVWAHMQHKRHIAELEDEIVVYQSEFERNRDEIHQLQHNPKAIERIARERYFMKMADEDVFVLSDDVGKELDGKITANETAE